MEHDSIDSITRTIEWLGVDGSLVRAHLDRYVDWLQEEAIPAGGLGPSEASRLVDRHIADSLVFAGPLGLSSELQGGSLLDVGTGVGLPGIPLAICYPSVAFTLLDRAGRRKSLLSRAVRILGLENVDVVQFDADSYQDTHRYLTFRASLPLVAAVRTTARLLDADGVAVFAISRTRRPDPELVTTAMAAGVLAEIVSIPSSVLDSSAWLLRMTSL